MSEGALQYWQSMTTVEVERFVARDPVVILPLAAVEQHGPHLPLSTDLDIGLGLLDAAFGQLGPDVPAAVLPPLAVGASREHMRYAGTLSLDPETLGAVAYQQCMGRRPAPASSASSSATVTVGTRPCWTPWG